VREVVRDEHTTAPLLETERLRLRAPRRTDFENSSAMWTDPIVNRYFAAPLSREDAWSKFLRYPGHWNINGYGFWVCEEKATGAWVGELGFADFKRTMMPSLGDHPEAGWVLAPRAHGKGYATEAMRAATAWIETRYPKSVCIIHPNNAPSLRVAEKLGFRESHRSEYKEHPVIVFERTSAFRLRPASTHDIPEMQSLIARSVRELQTAEYTEAQREGALRHVYGVDTALIADGTYFAVECGRAIVACGGWSKRKTLFGGDQLVGREDSFLDPATDAAKVRAFFVHPEWSRRGLGRIILEACEKAAASAGFRRIEMGATLSGVAFYRAHGYEALESIEVPLDPGLTLPILRMGKNTG
jgi:RimJ/RimL family protein N-acetyltransferase/N-acetylglutamate synthase-like GNAT family acetyltransferase